MIDIILLKYSKISLSNLSIYIFFLFFSLLFFWVVLRIDHNFNIYKKEKRKMRIC